MMTQANSIAMIVANGRARNHASTLLSIVAPYASQRKISSPATTASQNMVA